MSQPIVQKTVDFKIGDEGTVEAIFSTFDVADRDGDVVLREAMLPYDGQEVPMVSSHDWSLDGWIGKGRISIEDREAKFSGSFFMDDPDGQAAFRKVKAMQGISQWSWAFRVGKSEFGQKDGQRVRYIKALAERPYEVSPVLVGANPLTSTVGIKGHVLEDKQDIHEQLKALKQQHDESCGLGDDCPLHVKAPEEPEEDPISKFIPDERKKALKELEAALGYRPLIADKV